jgi:hypothetical protein
VSNRVPPSKRPGRQPAPGDEEAIAELLALATIAIKGNPCSLLLPDFMEGIQRDMGHETPAPNAEIHDPLMRRL